MQSPGPVATAIQTFQNSGAALSFNPTISLLKIIQDGKTACPKSGSWKLRLRRTDLTKIIILIKKRP